MLILPLAPDCGRSFLAFCTWEHTQGPRSTSLLIWVWVYFILESLHGIHCTMKQVSWFSSSQSNGRSQSRSFVENHVRLTYPGLLRTMSFHSHQWWKHGVVLLFLSNVIFLSALDSAVRWSIFLSEVGIPWFLRSQLSKAFPMSAHPSDSVIPTGRELRFSVCLRGDSGRKLAWVTSWVVETSTLAIPCVFWHCTKYELTANAFFPASWLLTSGSTFCLLCPLPV